MSRTESPGQPESDGSFVPLSAEAHRAAADAADQAGLPLSVWLSQIIKYAGYLEIGRTDTGSGRSRSARSPAAGQEAAAAGDADRRGPEHDARPETGTKLQDRTEPVDEAGASATPREVIPVPPPRPAAPAQAGAPVVVPLGTLRPGALGPAAGPSEQEIEACLAAHRQAGGFPPIVVRRIEDRDEPAYEIVTGEECWRAAQRAQVEEVPVEIRIFSDRDAFVFSVRDAMRRRRMPVLDEAAAYRRMIGEFGLSEVEVADAVGETRAHVVNTISLLDLPRAVQKMIGDGVLSKAHARALLEAHDPEAIAAEVAGHDYDIFQTEQLIRIARRRAGGSAAGAEPHD